MIKENINIEGHFAATIFEKNKNIWQPIEKIDVKNQILNDMLTHVVNMMAYDYTNEITKLTFGTNDATPVRTDTRSVMTDAYTNMLIGSPVLSTYNSIKYEFSLLPSENNGVTITEYALTLTDDTIVTRVVSGEVVKSDNIRIDGSWEITFNI